MESFKIDRCTNHACLEYQSEPEESKTVDKTQAVEFKELTLMINGVHINAKYAEFRASLATLCNGAVFVTTSNINLISPLLDGDSKSPVFMLGLFAGRDFKEGEHVTTYGGILKHKDICKSLPTSEQTHLRTLYGSDYCLDGLPYAKQFDASQRDMRKEAHKTPLARKKFFPSLVKCLEQSIEQNCTLARSMMEIDAYFCRPNVLPSLCSEYSSSREKHCSMNDGCIAQEKQARLQRHLCSQICHGPIGYMANTTNKKDINLRVEYFTNKTSQRETNNLVFIDIVYVASKQIRAGDELYAPYNNGESRSFL